MNILFYIDQDNYNINRLSKYYSKDDNVFIFTTYCQIKSKYENSFPVFYYSDLDIDAQKGVFKGLLQKSYQLTYSILASCIKHLHLGEEQKNLVNAIPSKLHRVISEALRAEAAVERIIDHFKPQKVYTIKKFRNAFTWRVASNDNFEAEILRKYCHKNNIEHQTIPVYLCKYKEYFVYRTKELVKRLKSFTLDRFLGRVYRKIYISQKISPNNENKPVILIYMFGYMFYRNQIIWKYFNEDKKHYYLFITDHLSDDHKHILEGLSNLNFIHIKGLIPFQKSIPNDKRILTAMTINDSLGQELLYSRKIISKYLSEYIFGIFDNYLVNHEYIKTVINKYKIVEVIFPSYWEIQPSLLISDYRNKGIPTLALQAGINPKNAKEISLTDRYAVYGKWDFENFCNSDMDQDQLFILGWPLGTYYKSIQFVRKKIASSNVNILYLLSMAGSWQYFIHFPEDSIILDLIDVAQHNSNVNFTLRTHGGNNNKKFKKLIKDGLISNIELNNTGSLLEVLRQTDYVFTQATTAGFESMVLGIPTFCLSLHSDKEATPFSRINSKYIANSKDDLISIIRELQNNPGKYMIEYEDSKSDLLANVFNPTFEYSKLISTKSIQGQYNEN